MVQASDNPVRTLLVEDQPADAALIAERLLRLAPGEFVLDRASTLSEGIHRASDGDHGIALLDLGLPDSNGLDTCRAIRTAAPELPLVVLTGSSDGNLAREALRAGAQDFLVKSECTGPQLVRSLRFAVERSRATSELQRQALELRASEARMRALIARNADGLLVCRLDGTVVLINAAAEGLLGKRGAEIIGTQLGIGLAPGMTREIELIREEIVGDPVLAEASGNPDYDQRPLRLRQVRFITVELKVADSEWAGEPVHLVALRDITARREAERQRLCMVRFSEALSLDLDLERVYDKTATELARLLQYHRMEITLIRPDVRVPQVVATSGVEITGAGVGDLLPDAPVHELIWAGGEDGDHPRSDAQATGLVSWAQVPLGDKDEPVGFLALGSRRLGAYTRPDLDLLRQVAARAHPAIQNARRHVHALRMASAPGYAGLAASSESDVAGPSASTWR